MTRLRSLIKEVLSQPKKKDCGCGCNTCGDKAPILTEGKFKSLISEGLQHHIDKKISLFESIYRIGSEKHLELIREARALWIRGIIEVSDDDKGLLETHLGHFGLYEGVEVPLDLPMVNEEVEIKKSIKKIEDDDVILDNGKKFKVDYIEPWSAGGRILNGTYLESGKEGTLKIKFLTPRGNTGLADDTMLTVLKKSLNEVHKLFRQTNLSPEEYQKAKTLKDWDKRKDDYTWNPDTGLWTKEKKSSLKEAAVDYDFSKEELIRVIKQLKRGASTEVEMIKAFEKALGRELTDDEIRGFKLNEVTRYSGFNRNPEDPDSVPFEPTGAVAQFKKDLKALFGKFKGDLKNPEFIKGVAEIMVNWKSLLRSQLDEAKKKKKKEKKDPPLNKPKRGGSKAYYVYVRDPKTKKIKKVSFGSGGLRAKIKNKEARNAFAARHNCKNKKDRTKAGYWSCNLPRYAEQLGLGSKMNTFW